MLAIQHTMLIAMARLILKFRRTSCTRGWPNGHVPTSFTKSRSLISSTTSKILSIWLSKLLRMALVQIRIFTSIIPLNHIPLPLPIQSGSVRRRVVTPASWGMDNSASVRPCTSPFSAWRTATTNFVSYMLRKLILLLQIDSNTNFKHTLLIFWNSPFPNSLVERTLIHSRLSSSPNNNSARWRSTWV